MLLDAVLNAVHAGSGLCWKSGHLEPFSFWGPKFRMPDHDPTPDLYCPNCAKPVSDPLVCGDCRAVICRICGTPLERADELGIG